MDGIGNINSKVNMVDQLPKFDKLPTETLSCRCVPPSLARMHDHGSVKFASLSQAGRHVCVRTKLLVYRMFQKQEEDVLQNSVNVCIHGIERSFSKISV
jgi:hypothetical protein